MAWHAKQTPPEIVHGGRPRVFSGGVPRRASLDFRNSDSTVLLPHRLYRLVHFLARLLFRVNLSSTTYIGVVLVQQCFIHAYTPVFSCQSRDVVWMAGKGPDLPYRLGSAICSIGSLRLDLSSSR